MLGEQEKFEKRKETAKQKMRVAAFKELDKMMDRVEETLEDIAEDFLIDSGFEPVDDEEGDPEAAQQALDTWMGLVSEVVDDSVHYWHGSVHGPVWVMVSFDRDRGIKGIEVEVFGTRPKSWVGGDWPDWFRVYEGSIDGGDTVLGDARGANFG